MRLKWARSTLANQAWSNRFGSLVLVSPYGNSFPSSLLRDLNAQCRSEWAFSNLIFFSARDVVGMRFSDFRAIAGIGVGVPTFEDEEYDWSNTAGGLELLVLGIVV